MAEQTNIKHPAVWTVIDTTYKLILSIDCFLRASAQISRSIMTN